MIRVTADSNIYISALHFGGPSDEFLDLARNGIIELTISDDILAEVTRVLRDKGAQNGAILAGSDDEAKAIELARSFPGLAGMDPPTYGLLDVQVRRNDYGSQGESFEAPIHVEGLPGGPFPGVFIRSPRIHSVGPGATAFAWRGGEAVGVRAGAIWGLAFHPELSGDTRLHRMFLEAAHAAAARAPTLAATRKRARKQ